MPWVDPVIYSLDINQMNSLSGSLADDHLVTPYDPAVFGEPAKSSDQSLNMLTYNIPNMRKDHLYVSNGDFKLLQNGWLLFAGWNWVL